MAGVQTHWLRGNASEWSPKRVLFIDTETRATPGKDRETLGLSMWCGGMVNRGSTPHSLSGVSSAHGEDRHSLARWVDAQTVGVQTVWLYAHNLGFDLTVSRLPDFLNQLGWTMTTWQFAGRNVTGGMKKRSKRLRLCDSGSLLPTDLGTIGRQLGRPKLPMPGKDASPGEWLEYCSNDVLILAEAVLTIMDWWDREKLGHWTSSGPGLGWNALRHLGREKMICIDRDNGQPSDDRAAVRGGRRDVTRVGEIPGGPFALVDFSNAYLTVAATMPTPRKRLGFYESLDEKWRWWADHGYGILANCEIETAKPEYPLRTPTGIFYPTGRFRTVLCSPEVVRASQQGTLVSVGEGWVHDLAYPLQSWAQWCLGLLSGEVGPVEPVVTTMVKQWGRSVIGKFAARSARQTDLGPALYPHWKLIRGTTGPDHAPAADVHIGGRHWWYQMDQEGDNAYPAVLAWVESYVRVALNNMLDMLGEDMWVCCDTDGAVLDLTKARSWLSGRSLPLGPIRGPQTVAEAVCEAVRGVCWPLVPRVKLLSETLTVAGPQHYSGDSFERMAGRPGKPEKDADGHWVWYSWPKVKWQMAEGDPSGYIRTEVNWTHPSQLAHRWVLNDGVALPVQAAIDSQGNSYIKPWNDHPLADMLADEIPGQSRALQGLY